MPAARIAVLLWVDILAVYAMYMMMAYLTNVWKLGFTHAAAILNVFWGAVTILPLFQVFLVDTIMGNYWMLLFSSMAYSAGLGLLSMSTPPALAHSMGTCSEYAPECVGEGQKMLFYAALAFIAIGLSGHLTSLGSFIQEQIVQAMVNIFRDHVDSDAIFGLFWRSFLSTYAVFIAGCAAVLALPFIKPWSLRFGIPAICTLFATLMFVSGSCSYTIVPPVGSSFTTFFRVFVAAFSKLFHRTPRDSRELYEIQDNVQYLIPHTKSLRCLDKASIVIPAKPLEEQRMNRWKLCKVTEVEETKTIIRMVPVWMTFILCGVVSAVGFTFFVEQLNHLNPKVGKLKVPIVVLLWFYEQAQNKFAELYASFANWLGGLRRFGPPIGIAMSMILAILCCIMAAKVEDRRLGVVQKHGLVDKPDERVPMTMFWLLPQFILLGAFDGTFRSSAICFFVDQAPVSTQRCLPFQVLAVYGLGIAGSVVSVFVVGKVSERVGKVSERGGKANWFQHNLNGSRVDKYYWTLAWLMAINLVIFVVVAVLYRHKESRLRDEEGVEFGGIEEPYDESTRPLLLLLVVGLVCFHFQFGFPVQFTKCVFMFV